MSRAKQALGHAETHVAQTDDSDFHDDVSSWNLGCDARTNARSLPSLVLERG
jgi:hypothetical protein